MAGYDISAAFSDATTQGFKNRTGAFNVGGNGGTNWLIIGLIGLAALGLWLWLD
jgi:hypothetical protein